MIGKKLNLLLFFSVFFIGGFLAADLETYQLKPDKIVKIYENNQEYLLNKPSDFFVTSDEIVISDMGDHCVIISTGDGLIKSRFGELGQGPTDLNKPYRVFPYKNGIGVLDSGNYKIKLFTKKGELIKQFPASTMAGLGGWVCFNRDGSYCSSTEGYAKDYLISFRTIEGQEKGQIGKIYGEVSYIYKFETEEVKKGNVPNSYKNRVIPLFDDENNIICVHRSLPLIKKYNLQGELLWEIKIRGKEIDEIRKKWIVANKRTPSNVAIRLEYWRDIQYHKEAIYLLLYITDRLVIYKAFENSGRMVKLVGKERGVAMIRVLGNDLWAYSDEGQYFLIYKNAVNIGHL